jgi:hypothetical protein
MAKAKSEDQEPDFSGLDDLPDEPVEAPPQIEAEPEAPESEEPETPGQPEARAEEPQEADPILEVGGISRKRSEWQKFLQDSETWRNQASHFQGKYTDLLEQVRGAKQQPTETESLQRGPTLDQIRAYYAPVVRQIVEKKPIGEEWSVHGETWPEVTADMLYERDRAHARMDRQDQEIAALKAERQERITHDQEVAFSGARQTFNDALDAMAGEEQFASFADAKARDGYRDYFIENFGHLPLEKLTPDFVRKQAVAYLAPAFEQAIKAAQTKPKPTRRNAAGEGSAARPSGRSVETDLEKAFKELDEA